MRRGDVSPAASLSKDRRGTCARRVTPYLPGCCLTSFCALQEPKPRGKRYVVLRIIGAVGHNARMANAANFKLALTRKIEPTAGPGAELATLEDAARFIALMKPFRKARPHWDFVAELLLRAAETGKRRDAEAATAQMERALRVEGWL